MTAQGGRREEENVGFASKLLTRQAAKPNLGGLHLHLRKVHLLNKYGVQAKKYAARSTEDNRRDRHRGARCSYALKIALRCRHWSITSPLLI